MRNRAIARRYAQALFELGREQDILTDLDEELRAVQAIFAENPALAARLEHPRVAKAEKFAILDDVFADRVSRHILNLLRLLVEKRREGYLDLIHEEFRHLHDEARGVTMARVRVATELDRATLDKIKQELGKALNRDVRLQVEVDPDLIGGLVIQIGDRRIDSSLRRRLQSLRSQIAAGRDLGVSQA